jgi:2-polyprenyl-3-methyl-5-hydroxy-6-metoxy-1,4-benzoquinol methylase
MPIEADVILSITLLEHVPDNKSAFESMYSTLRPGGYMAHYVPSKWHPYSISLRLVGPRLQKKLIAILRPDAVEVTGYPAYFSYCSPSEMIKLAKETGFMNVKTTCYHRANDYFAFFFPAFVVVTLFEELCRKLRWTFFASGFLIEGAKRDG